MQQNFVDMQLFCQRETYLYVNMQHIYANKQVNHKLTQVLRMMTYIMLTQFISHGRGKGMSLYMYRLGKF